jgi:hypothetical protein
MKWQNAAGKQLLAITLLPAFIALWACHSYHVETTVENRTGATIQQVEVDYPSASFGTDTLGSGETYHYRIQLQGRSALKVVYRTINGHLVQIDGPMVSERQEGKLQIVLLPGGKAEFNQQMTPLP